jgi:PAS domain S-box-containing protein
MRGTVHPEAKRELTSVKGSVFRQPAAMALGGAAVTAVAALNALAFVSGSATPWLLGSVLVVDMLLLGGGILVAAREVLIAERRTESNRAQYEAILDSAMDAIISVDAQQRIVLFNRAAENVFRCRREEALGGTLERFIPQRFRAEHAGHIEQFGRTGVTSRRMGDVTTLWGLRADGEEFPIEASISQTVDAGERYFTVILRDITLRRQAEVESEKVRAALDDAQARLGAIVDSAMDAVITVDESQKVVLFNRAAEQVFRVSREQALGGPLERFIPQRFRAGHAVHIANFGSTGVTSRRMGDVTTLWALRADTGDEVPIEASISQAVEGGRRYYTVILRDITLRKQAEDESLRQQAGLRQLSAQVLEAREDEKTRIARELHDELGQSLTAMKIDLQWVHERLPGDPALAEKADQITATLDQLVTSVRRIAADLRPLMLDDLGLADAAAWLAEQTAERGNVKVDFQLEDGSGLETLDKVVASAVYRAMQESFTNIAKHARASHAWVILSIGTDEVRFEVEDDGQGIAPDDLAKVKSLGLKGMRERVTYLGGTLEVARAPRGGTRVRLRVPARPAAETPV